MEQELACPNRTLKLKIMTTFTLIAAGFLVFGLLFKAIDFFEKI